VFYELAIRHALQRPLVQLIDSAQELPFDIKAMRTIFFDIHDLDSVAQAKQDLRAFVGEVESGDVVETPISIARDVKSLWETERPTDQLIAEMFQAVEELLADKRARDASARRRALMPEWAKGAGVSQPEVTRPLRTAMGLEQQPVVRTVTEEQLDQVRQWLKTQEEQKGKLG
jgi:hypothetical protein